jgi:hypothetical protein
MGLQDDLIGIEMKIADAVLNEVDDKIMNVLKAEQRALKKQWQLMELHNEIEHAYQKIIAEKRQALYRHQNLIEALGSDLYTIQNGLQDAFESRTGTAINERLNEEKGKIRTEYEWIYAEALASCKIGWF